MTFSFETKKQIAQKISGNPCCQMAEFLALTKSDGTIGIAGGEGPYLKISTENAAAAKKIYKLAKELFPDPGRFLVYKNHRFKKNNRFELRIPYQNDSRGVLKSLGLVGDDGSWRDFSPGRFPSAALAKDCCKRAYLRGAFLGSGSINSIASSYHLEIVTASGEYAEGLKELMADFVIHGKICRRKNQYVVYLKNGDQIGEFLLYIDAHQAYLAFESERVRRDLNNQLNRRHNFDLANLNKVADAGAEQNRAVQIIEMTVGLESLSPALKEAALLRKEDKSASLGDLAKRADPPVSKSGMSHRLRKIVEIAKELEQNETRGDDRRENRDLSANK